MLKDEITKTLINILGQTISKEGLDLSNLEISSGTNYFSVKIIIKMLNKTPTILMFRLSLSGKKKYIGFHVGYSDLFVHTLFRTYQIKSDPEFIRVEINQLYDLFSLSDQLIYICKDKISMLPIDAFACCSSHMECSNEKKCPKTQFFYKGCQYRKALEKGQVFFGINRNIVEPISIKTKLY